MSGTIIFDGEGPKTQSIDAVKALIAYHHHSQEPAEMPDFYRLSRDMVLALSGKRDAYYVVTNKACSCPSFTHRGGPCKHQRKYFPQPKKSLAEIAVIDEPSIQLSGFRPTLPTEA